MPWAAYGFIPLPCTDSYHNLFAGYRFDGCAGSGGG